MIARIMLAETRAELTKFARLPAYVIPTLAFPVAFYAFFGLALNGSQHIGAFGVHRVRAVRLRRERRVGARSGLALGETREPDAARGVLHCKAPDDHGIRDGHRPPQSARFWASRKAPCATILATQSASGRRQPHRRRTHRARPRLALKLRSPTTLRFARPESS